MNRASPKANFSYEISSDPRPRVAGYVPRKNGNNPLRNGNAP